jgi:PadR family transcriptional regulator PadR
MSRPSDLVQGTLDLLVLKLLALQPMHGWAIAGHLESVSDGELRVSATALYEALHRMEQDGWIKGTWKASANNRRAKYYALTRAGTRRLSTESSEWNRLSAAIGRVIRLRTLGA